MKARGLPEDLCDLITPAGGRDLVPDLLFKLFLPNATAKKNKCTPSGINLMLRTILSVAPNS